MVHVTLILTESFKATQAIRGLEHRHENTVTTVTELKGKSPFHC